MKLASFIVLLLAAALSAFCFSTGRPELGAINAAIAMVNVILIARATGKE
jgi:hypothetical protein